MGAEHRLPPADPLDAVLAIVRLDDAGVHHLPHCLRCRIAWYRAGAFRAGCTDPRLGVALMGAARGSYTFFSHLKWTWAIALGYVLSIWVHFLVNG